MASITSLLRKYHRQLAIITAFPIILLTVTGFASPILEALGLRSIAEAVRRVHSGKIFFGTGYFLYTTMSGLGLLGLLVTGLSITRPFSPRHRVLRVKATEPQSKKLKWWLKQRESMVDRE